MELDTQPCSALHEDPLPRDGENPSRLDRYQKDLEQAQRELEEEKHKPLGLFDDMLNLLCWIETPEERLHKNQLARVTLGEVGGRRTFANPQALENAESTGKLPGMATHLAQRMLLALAKAK